MTSRSSRNTEGGRGSLRPDRLCGCSGLPGSVAGTTNEPVTSSFGPTPGWPCKQAPGGEPGLPAGSGDQRELVARLRAVIEAKDTEIAVLRAELAAERERCRRLELRVAELERRLGSDSTTSGTPPSKDPIGARERRKAERKARQSSERERRKDRKRGGQPGHPGAGLSRDPDPDERTRPRRRRSARGAGPAWTGAAGAGTWWSQVRDVNITPFVTEYLLPLLACPCCGKVNAAEPPPWAHPGSISYGPGINTAAVLLPATATCPPSGPRT